MIAQSSSLALMVGMIAALCVTPATAAVTISTDATANMNCVSGVCTPTAADAVLNVGDLTGMLASGNVTVNTGTGSLPQQVEDIIVAAPFNWASANGLTLDAYRSVTVDQPVADNGSGAVTLTTNDGGTGGNLSFLSGGSLSFLGTSNSLTINRTAYALENTLASLASAIAANPAGAYAFASSYDASHDGTYSQSPVPTTFTGSFEGFGNTISNVTVRGGNDLVPVSVGGLFSQVDGGSVSNIGLVALSLTAGKNGYAGGLVGENGGGPGTLYGDHVSGKMSVDKMMGGGLVGLNANSTVSNSYAAVDIVGKEGAGGLVGGNGGIIDNSFATGSVKAAVGGGGLAGSNIDKINNSYATGSVKGGTGSYVGGVVGYNGGDISTSYSTGKGSAGPKSDVGGLLGENDTNPGTTNCYWDTKTSGTNVGVGSGGVSGYTGLTSQQLRSGLPSGFDPKIWAESPSINHGFPYLIANPPQ
jgi:hypothetical protein